MGEAIPADKASDVLYTADGHKVKGRPATVGAQIIHNYWKTYYESQKEKKSYMDKLESAKDDEIFKYLLLIDTSALEGYISQTRIQAAESFKLSKYISVAGFGLISAGIVLGLLSSYLGSSGIDAAYLASLAGILTEFISGVFFYLYNRTLQQLNLFHDKMLASKHVITSFLANSLIKDEKKRDDSKIELSKALISTSVQEK